MLYLYKGITPNFTKTHYLFSDFNNYLTFLETYKIKEINNDKYTLNNLSIRIKLDESISELDYKNVTYIINTSDNVCYLVNNSKIQSGYIFFNVSIDNWGTYISKASFSDILIGRCNRQLNDDGIYDEIIKTKDFNVDRIGEKVKLQDLCGIWIVKSGVRLHLLGCDLKTAIPWLTVFEWVNPMLIISRLLYSTAINYYKTGLDGAGRDAQVIRFFIVPKDSVELDTMSGIDQYSLWDGGGEGGIRITNVLYPILPKNYVSYLTLEYDLNKDYFIGGINNGLHIRKTISKTGLKIIYNYGIDNIHVIVSDGNEQQDITNSFELPCINTQTTKDNNQMAKSLQIISGVVSSGIGIVTKSPLSLVKGITRLGEGIGGLINQDEPKSVTNIVNSGDALTTYFDDNERLESLDTPCFKYPLCINYSTSLINEEVRARKTGALFNCYIDNIETIFTYSLIGSGETTDDTYIQANMEVSNIPTDAINDITSKFNNGVNTQLL